MFETGQSQSITHTCDPEFPRVYTTWTGLSSQQSYTFTVAVKGDARQSYSFMGNTNILCAGMRKHLECYNK